MTDEKGNLSIDFLVGFTIFLLAFIWVVSMIPGLLIGLQSYTIDFDAVAYRTGVILVEDPGWPAAPPWESYNDLQKFSVTRFGLALSRDRPNILSQDKVNRFFCTTAFIYPDDYHQRAIFGDYPYRFNISILDREKNKTQSVGGIIPDGYGYSRRIAKIKEGSYATIDASSASYHKTDNVNTHVFSIEINNSYLLSDITNLAYQIDPAREKLVINITNLSSMSSTCNGINLTNIKVYKLDAGIYSPVPYNPATNNPYIDGSSVRVSSMPTTVTDNITLGFTPYFFDQMKAQNSQIFIAMRFDVTTDCIFLNNTQALPDYDGLDGILTYYNPATKVKNLNTTPFEYDYNATQVTQPKLKDAIVEVSVW